MTTITRANRVGDGTGLWRCVCGYINLDDAKCPMCHRGAPEHTIPTGAGAKPPIRELWEQAHPDDGSVATEWLTGHLPPVVDARTGRRAMRTVVGIIALNLIVQGVVLGVSMAQHFTPRRALEVSLITAVVFYSAVAIRAAARASYLGLRPRWLVGSAPRALGEGIALGLAGGIAVTLLVRLAVGHTMVDPIAVLLVGQRFLVVALGVGVIAGLAPVVEELVFRGFLAESFRISGRRRAVIVSAVAFSVAHLRVAQLPYYALLGVALGLLYWRRGLLASICAHAAFNGTLIAVAVIVAHGPATTVTADGLRIRVPSTWHQTRGQADLSIVGPQGAVINVTHRNVPSGTNVDLNALATALRSGLYSPQKGSTLDTTSLQVDRAPIGPMLRMRATVNGHEDDGVVMVVGSRAVSFDFFPDGSARATRDFDQMLSSLTAT